MNDLEARLIVVIVLISLALLFCIATIIAMRTRSNYDSPLKRFRKLLTPPCRECVWYIAPCLSAPRCRCPKALTYYEKMFGDSIFDQLTGHIRGTHLCKFKSIEEAKNEKKMA